MFYICFVTSCSIDRVLLIDGASTCVGCGVEKEGKESFEDRRHASNMNPYLVEAMRMSSNPSYEILFIYSSSSLFNKPRKDLYQ